MSTATLNPESTSDQKLGYAIGELYRMVEALIFMERSFELTQAQQEAVLLSPASGFAAIFSLHGRLTAGNKRIAAKISEIAALPEKLSDDQRNFFWLGYWHQHAR
jgi:hypothetical protein